MIALLLVAQLAAQVPTTDSVYATPALRDAVAAAALANREPPPELRGYRAHVESELGLLVRDTLGRESMAEIEQFASSATWDRGGRYELHVEGYRAQSVGVPYSILSIIHTWTVPWLYGQRLNFGTTFARRGDTVAAVHPFASDRDRYYEFSGGDTITVLHLGTRQIPISRIRVRPRGTSARPMIAFDGEIDLDAERHQIVRMRGSFVPIGPNRKRPLVARLLGVEGAVYVEFVNAEVAGKYWLPASQRTEFQASVALMGRDRPVFRIVSRFSDFAVDDSAGAAADSVGRVHTILSWAPGDSLDRFDGWQNGLGVETSAVRADDFEDMAPEAWKTVGGKEISIYPTALSRDLRFNRVEGLYTGIEPTVRLDGIAPGLSATANAGWAWAEHTARGGGVLRYQNAAGSIALIGDRALATTEQFTPPFESDDPGIAALLSSIDDHDYVDRERLMFAATRIIGNVDEAFATARFDVDHDRAEAARVSHGLFGPDFAPNLIADSGRYVHGTVGFEFHPSVTGDYVQPGFGLTAYYDVARGDLSWQRLKLGLSARQYLGSFTFGAHADAGLVQSAAPPPQVLFTLGGTEGLPGYAYKTFAGDRAALVRSYVSYRFPILKRPIPAVRGYYLPALNPGVAVSISGGWSQISSPAAQLAAAKLNGSTGQPPAATDGLVASVGAGVTLLSDILHIGAARSVARGGKWRLALGAGLPF